LSQRTARLDELLREEITRILSRDVDDPRVGFVTITDVEVTPDLRHATVWASAIGQPDERKASLRALGHAMPFVRRRLGVLRLKRIPELHLKTDDTAERGTRVLRILDDLEHGLEVEATKPQETLPTPGPAPDLEGEEPQVTDGARPAAGTRPLRAQQAKGLRRNRK
jgi:ribosome-binding factor A